MNEGNDKYHKYCVECGSQLLTDAQFCSKCGNNVSIEKIQPNLIDSISNRFSQNIFTYLLYFIGISVILNGIIELVKFNFLGGFTALLAGLILFPQVRNLVVEKINMPVHRVIWIIAFLFLMFIASATSTEINSVNQSSISSDTKANQEIVQTGNDENSQKANTENIYAIGETIKVGYTSYVVNGFKWKKRIGNEYIGTDANARFLIITITVRNNDKKARMVPPFYLIDEAGSEYQASTAEAYLGDDAFTLTSLNPSVKKTGLIVFDVPPEHHYKLKVSGGYWSGEDTLVQIN